MEHIAVLNKIRIRKKKKIDTGKQLAFPSSLFHGERNSIIIKHPGLGGHKCIYELNICQALDSTVVHI